MSPVVFDRELHVACDDASYGLLDGPGSSTRLGLLTDIGSFDDDPALGRYVSERRELAMELRDSIEGDRNRVRSILARFTGRYGLSCE